MNGPIMAGVALPAVAASAGKPPVAFASPDGIHWRKMQDAPVITRGAFDSLNVAFWDKAAGRYRCFSRYFDHGKRAIQSATSEDFLRWTEPVPHQYAPGVPLEHFYTNATVPCPGAPHILLSLPKRFVPERKKVVAHPDTGVSDAIFLSSRDDELAAVVTWKTRPDVPDLAGKPIRLRFVLRDADVYAVRFEE